jgi:hypothetical protein
VVGISLVGACLMHAHVVSTCKGWWVFHSCLISVIQKFETTTRTAAAREAAAQYYL